MTTFLRRLLVLAALACATGTAAAWPVDGPGTPPLWEIEALLTWANTAEPLVVVALLVRALLVAALAWTTVCAVLLVLLDAGRAALLVPQGMRRALGPLLGLTLLIGPVASGATAQETPEPVAIMRAIDSEPIAMRAISLPGRSGPVIPEVINPAAEQLWEVRAGDHFWTIAEATLDRRPAGTDLEQHWRDLIELNRHRLPDPSNPDLILPGMRLQLP